MTMTEVPTDTSRRGPAGTRGRLAVVKSSFGHVAVGRTPQTKPGTGTISNQTSSRDLSLGSMAGARRPAVRFLTPDFSAGI